MQLALFSEFAISASGRVGNEHRYLFGKMSSSTFSNLFGDYTGLVIMHDRVEQVHL